MSLPTLGDGLAWDTSDVTIGASVSVVPDPSTWAMLMAGTLGLL